ncbi:MAG TPA: energy transducer TonB [Chryseolinea sp.]|nr:energy transducer TonB [Chryseolinea sp.]
MPNSSRILLISASLTFLHFGAAGYSHINMIRDTTVEAKGDSIYLDADEMAQYPGGMDALAAFLANKVQYPARARTRGDQGSVFVSFIVEKDGTLSDIKIAKGISEELDQESIRVVRLFPPWIPGKKDGIVARTRFVLPIKYKLQEVKKLRRRDWH